MTCDSDLDKGVLRGAAELVRPGTLAFNIRYRASAVYAVSSVHVWMNSARAFRALQNEQLYAMLVVRIGVLEASMFARLGERLGAWRIRHVARTAFQDQVGFAAHGEPIDAGLSVQERAAVAHRIDAWLRDQVAHTATPYGVSHCCVLIRLVDERVRRTVAWTYRSAAFERVAVAEALTQVSEHIQTLPLGDYPMANRIEAHLISLGAVVQHADVARRVSAEK